MDEFGEAAFVEAERSLSEGGIPIGSVLVWKGQIIGSGHNRRVQKGSAILHAEMDALENAGRRSASVYRESILYTTLSPCPMCAGAILLYQIPKVVIGEAQNFKGEATFLRKRGIMVDILEEHRCLEMMTRFIDSFPELWKEDISV